MVHHLISLRALVILFALIAIGVGVFMLRTLQKAPPVLPAASSVEEEASAPAQRQAVIGKSVEGRDIEAYTYGSGPTHLLFVGGIHGGYEWNSVLLAYNFIDYFDNNPTAIPDTLTITIVPSANPDGVYKVIGKEGRFTLTDAPAEKNANGVGRFNAHNVDVNRNFDCKWQPTSTWRSNTVSAGTAPFSEPEAQAIRNIVRQEEPTAVVFWHSQSNAVYASQCTQGILPGTRTLMNTYAQASGYPAVDVFNAYTTTGAADDWLASIGIPAVTVELATHATVEWQRNLAAVQALLTHYATTSQ